MRVNITTKLLADITRNNGILVEKSASLVIPHLIYVVMTINTYLKARLKLQEFWANLS